ncbi:hypothetical protein [Agromyces sp. GXQ0307]|uniref:hypothetical protein n=1 Tax=Agromyces sp. GXQ0307 TaxID=3377835 RepID=UPI00383AD7A9
MDPNAARTILQIPIDQPLSLDLIDAAYQRELWLRHPSRYPDAEGRRAAEAWQDSLGRARAVLAAEVAAPSSPSPHPTAPIASTSSPRRLPAAAVAGIVAGGVLLIGALVAGGIGLFTFVQDVAETAIAESEGSAGPGAGGSGDQEPVVPGTDDIGRYESFETGYEFPAALEMYGDGRYDDRCATGFVEGCWQAALFTEADCDALEITLAFNDDAESWVADETETRTIADVRADVAVPVVFGNDDREFGWVDQVRCTDGAST